MPRPGPLSLIGMAVLLLGLNGAPVRAQQRPGCDPAQAAALFAQARPHLEEVIGRRANAGEATGGPRFVVSSSADLAQLPDAELQAQLRWLFPELKDEAFGRAVQAASETLGRICFARHQEGSEVIHLADRPPRRWETDEALAAADTPAFYQLALVHEAARATLSRRYDLPRRWAGCRDGEEFQALQAVVEGRALGVTRQVARRLGTDKYFPLLVRRHLGAPEADVDKGLRVIVQAVLKGRRWAGEAGLAFYDRLEAQRVPDLEKQLFARPPRQVVWIEQPERFLKNRTDRPDLADVLAQLGPSVFPETHWTVASDPWTPAMVRRVAAMFGEGKRAEKLMQSWSDGRFMVGTLKGSTQGQVALGVSRWATPEGARAYFNLSVDLQRRQDELFATPCEGRHRILESRSTPVAFSSAPQAVRYDKQLQYSPGQEPVAVTMYLVQAGDLVIELTWHGLKADEGWTRAVADALVSQNTASR